MPTLKINKTNVQRLRHPETGQKLYLDSDLKGFGVLVSRSSKSYIAQRDIRGRTVRVTLGRHGVITADEARRDAITTIGKMAKGIDPRLDEKNPDDITLMDAYKLHLDVPKERSAHSKRALKLHVETYLRDWRNKPLTSISRQDVYDRHRKLGKERGEATANATMRTFRALYNRALRQAELPPNPTIAVDWYTLKPRDAALPSQLLKDWYAAVMEMENHIRRDYLRVVLFTGLRRANASEMEWEHLSDDLKTLYIPKPKSGRPFDLPLSTFTTAILKARRKENEIFFPGSPWVFPAASKSGHISEPREDDFAVPFTIHALRHTYVTQAQIAGADKLTIKLLVNHALPGGDVTEAYIAPDAEALRPVQEKVSRQILSSLDLKKRR